MYPKGLRGFSTRLAHGSGGPHQQPSAALRSCPHPRYHSLVVEASTLPAELETTAWTPDGLIMGLRHRERPMVGVQFHPESVLTPEGPTLVRNFLEGRY